VLQVLHKSSGIPRKVKRRPFVGDGDCGRLLVLQQFVAECDGVVVATEDQVHPLLVLGLKGETRLPETVTRMSRFAEQHRDALVYRPAALTHKLLSGEHIALQCLQPQSAILKNLPATEPRRPLRAFGGTLRR
jgi:hypothetical protein